MAFYSNFYALNLTKFGLSIRSLTIDHCHAKDLLGIAENMPNIRSFNILSLDGKVDVKSDTTICTEMRWVKIYALNVSLKTLEQVQKLMPYVETLSITTRLPDDYLVFYQFWKELISTLLLNLNTFELNIMALYSHQRTAIMEEFEKDDYWLSSHVKLNVKVQNLQEKP
ncbi:unnamed protein product, partial [Didymodactylos carnosus]